MNSIFASPNMFIFAEKTKSLEKYAHRKVMYNTRLFTIRKLRPRL